MAYNHRENCEASICQDEIEPNWKNDRVWCPGEKICQKKPYQKFQKMQIEINKMVALGKFRNMDEGYTTHDLETKSI
ncbi:MAG: hypothetical protein WC662_00520 [Candidatus Paceibacterota bacterium]|jgi:hypothetical protein